MGAAWYLLLLKNQNAPSAASTTTSPAIPAPIPAFAPVDSPLVDAGLLFEGKDDVLPVEDIDEVDELVVGAAKLYPSTGTAIMVAGSVKVVIAEV